MGHGKRRTVAFAAIRQQVRSSLEQGCEDQCNHHHNRPQRRQAQRQQGADPGRAGNPADAEQPVKTRHHGAPAGTLDDHGLQVDGGVDGAEPSAKQEQCGDQ